MKKKIYIWSFLYKLSLEVSYYLLISPLYSYSGLVFEPILGKLVLSYILFFSVLLYFPKNNKNPSSQLMALLIFTTYVPLLSIYWQANKSTTYISYVSLCIFLMIFILKYSKKISIKLLQTNKWKKLPIMETIFMISIILTSYFVVYLGGIDARAFDFSEVYSLRAEHQITGLSSYLINWLTRVLLPFLIVLSFYKKKVFLFFTSCVLQAIMYLMTGYKTIKFSIVLLIFGIYFGKKKMLEYAIPKYYAILITLSSVYYVFTKNLMSIAIVPTRQFQLPALISNKWFDFFSLNPKLNFSEGSLGKIFNIDRVYSIQSGFLVSGSKTNNENTGFLGDAFGNGGVIAMIVLSIIFAYILIIIDSLAIKLKDKYLFSSLFVYHIIILNDGSLITAFTTSGMFLMLLVLYIYASEENNIKKKREMLILKKDGDLNEKNI